VFKRLQRLKELEEVDFDDVAGSALTKKELLHLKRERDKLDRSLGGIRHMTRVPSAVWIVDTKKEHIAVAEARKLGIPVIAILDTNCDPDEVTYPIPGNDDAIRSVSLLTRVIADAVADGLIARAGAADGEEKPATADGVELATAEPLAEWERELVAGRPADEAGPASSANGVDVTTANGVDVTAAGVTANGTNGNGAAANGTAQTEPTAQAVEAAAASETPPPAPEAPAAEAPAPEAPATEAPAAEAPETAATETPEASPEA
jgi:small subunit ribosomal protein S2